MEAKVRSVEVSQHGLPRHRRGPFWAGSFRFPLGTNKEPEMALLLFVILEMMPPVCEPSVHARYLSGVKIKSACHWQTECRPHACVPTGPPVVSSACPLPQHRPCSNIPSVSIMPTVFAVCPVPLPRREPSILNAGHHQPHCHSCRYTGQLLGNAACVALRPYSLCSGGSRPTGSPE